MRMIIQLYAECHSYPNSVLQCNAYLMIVQCNVTKYIYLQMRAVYDHDKTCMLYVCLYSDAESIDINIYKTLKTKSEYYTM